MDLKAECSVAEIFLFWFFFRCEWLKCLMMSWNFDIALLALLPKIFMKYFVLFLSFWIILSQTTDFKFIFCQSKDFKNLHKKQILLFSSFMYLKNVLENIFQFQTSSNLDMWSFKKAMTKSQQNLEFYCRFICLFMRQRGSTQ